jgi:hypothetical protein
VGIHKALRADFNFVIVVRNPFDHIVLPTTHMLEMVASSMDMVSRLKRLVLIPAIEWFGIGLFSHSFLTLSLEYPGRESDHYLIGQATALLFDNQLQAFP